MKFKFSDLKFSIGFKKKDILALLAVFAILLAFFCFLFYAFEMAVWIAIPFASGFEVVACVLLFVKKKKPEFPLKQITGILIILVGIGAVAIPFVAQSVTARKQKEMIDDIESYFDHMEKKEAAAGEGEMVAAATEAALEQTVTNDALEKDNEIIKYLKHEEMYGILEVPAINIKYAIVEGGEREHVRTAVGHLTGSADAGQEGNCVIGGHRGGYYGTFFKNIDKLKEGDEVYVTDLNNNKYTYYVYEQKWIGIYDWDELQAIPGEKTLTLLSCEEHGELRIIVRARMIE